MAKLEPNFLGITCIFSREKISRSKFFFQGPGRLSEGFNGVSYTVTPEISGVELSASIHNGPTLYSSRKVRMDVPGS